MAKKIKPIKAEKFDDTQEFEFEEEIIEQEDEEVEDDYYEDETENEEVVEEESPNTFKAIEAKEDEEYYEDAKKTFRRANSENFMKIFNVLFIVAMIVMLIICVDVICVTKYKVGPIFAIKTKEYNDGGTKEYYGLGYKVIKYKEIEGRQDTQLGFWSMKYSTEPIIVEDVDLAIEFQNKPEETANKYYNQYVLVTSIIKEVDKEDNEIVLEYTDPDNKYTLDIKCEMASNISLLDNYKVKDKVSVKGTIYKFSVREADDSNSVTLSNCFVE